MNMKKRPVKLFLAAMLSAALFSCGNQSRQEDPKDIAEERNEEKMDDTDLKRDADFAVEAADRGLMEVQLAKLAQTKATSSEVKQFAQKIAAEHTKANDELKALAQRKNISLPAALSEDKQKKYNDLNEKKGLDFDRDYMDAMVSSHDESISKFEKEAEDGNDPEIKAWAANKLSTLRQHHDMAKTTHETVKNRKK
jgi:putative membrane protein